MFDASLVVQSAISTFNNAALRAPEFLWVALLCLPLFVAAWLWAPRAAQHSLFDAKTRNYKISVLAIALIFVWALLHGDYGVLRDASVATDGPASYVGILIAFVLYFCAKFLSREYYGPGREIRLSKILPVNDNRGRKIDLSVPPVIVVIAGLCAAGAGVEGVILQSGAVAIGFAAGFLLARKGAAASGDPKLLAAALMFAVAFGLIMQPEFFRFGQLAHLTVPHLAFLAATAAAVSAYAILHFVRPRGWFKDSVYKKLKLLCRAGAALVLLSLVMTESALVFAMFAVAMAVSAIIFVLHQPAPAATPALSKVSGSDGGGLGHLRHDIWLLSLGLFGVLTALPILTAAAIVLWRISNRKEWKRILGIF